MQNPANIPNTINASVSTLILFNLGAGVGFEPTTSSL